MIIVCEVSEMAMQTGFTEYDHMIQALAPNRADHPLDVSSLPGRSRCREHLFDTHRLHLASQSPPRRSDLGRVADGSAPSPTGRTPSAAEQSTLRSDEQ